MNEMLDHMLMDGELVGSNIISESGENGNGNGNEGMRE